MPTGLAAIFGGGNPGVTMCTWVAAGQDRRGRNPAKLGIMHACGREAAARLRSQDVTLPAGWLVEQDHPRRGLVVQVPAAASPEVVLDWALRAGKALCNVRLTGKWQAEVHFPAEYGPCAPRKPIGRDEQGGRRRGRRRIEPLRPLQRLLRREDHVSRRRAPVKVRSARPWYRIGTVAVMCCAGAWTFTAASSSGGTATPVGVSREIRRRPRVVPFGRRTRPSRRRPRRRAGEGPVPLRLPRGRHRDRLAAVRRVARALCALPKMPAPACSARSTGASTTSSRSRRRAARSPSCPPTRRVARG